VWPIQSTSANPTSTRSIVILCNHLRLVFLVASFPLAFSPTTYTRSSSPPFVLCVWRLMNVEWELDKICPIVFFSHTEAPITLSGNEPAPPMGKSLIIYCILWRRKFIDISSTSTSIFKQATSKKKTWSPECTESHPGSLMSSVRTSHENYNYMLPRR
jgi:hypothetical protein